MDRRAAVEAAEALAASATALAAALRGEAPIGSGTGGDDRDADPLRALANDFLDGLAETARIDAQASALRVHLAAGYSRAVEAQAPPPASPQENTAQEMAVIAEVACALTVRESAAAGLLVEARELTTALPLTMAALEAGRVSWQHARIMVDEASSLGPDGAQALEAHFLGPDAVGPARGCPVGDLVPGRFRAKARLWRERHHPVSIEKRYAKCVTDRRVVFAPDRDGMAWLSAYLPADTASGIWERTTAAARAMQGPGEDRTLTQLRADNAATWLLGGTCTSDVENITGENPNQTAPLNGAADGLSAMRAGIGADGLAGGSAGPGSGPGPGAGGGAGVPSPRAQVLITVPVMALLGVTEEPAMLDGYGPIPPSMARRLIADGADSFHRVLIDPRDGAPLEIGRSSYRVTKAQRQWLRLRDGRCPFPGCTNQSLDNEADHILAWADGGTTGVSNLGQPCHRHHRLRHTTAWTPTEPTQDTPPGWISPSGRQYHSEPPDWEPPTWPDNPPSWIVSSTKELTEESHAPANLAD
ncbi:HNH endonuclease signature motif containing protein [Pseudarthrobacter sulfonivorans]|uniref:HNH endonuclease signature motif containing protein n=1 Tax=Pseudarthrobacter sulfonivorans TaxID=121292 RepID=UPI0021078B9F|nr:HNH endonuclease signature motif containing protein [Pseudarthrobacter sulfonivorans]